MTLGRRHTEPISRRLNARDRSHVQVAQGLERWHAMAMARTIKKELGRKRSLEMEMTAATLRPELLEASDETIEDAVQYAGPDGAARPAVPADRRRRSRATRHLKTGRGPGYQRGPGGGERRGRRAAAAQGRRVLQGLPRRRGRRDARSATEDRLPTSLRLAVGVELADEDMGLYLEELALNPWARSLEWQSAPPPERLEDFTVVGHRRRHGRPQRRPAAQARRHPVHRLSRRTRASAAPGTRTATPGRGSTRRAAPTRNIFGVDFGYPNPFCPWTENERYFNWVADDVRAARRHRLRHRGALAHLGRGRLRVGDRDRRPRGRAHGALERGDHRGRLPQPAEHPRDRGHGWTSRARPGTRRAGPRTSTSRASGSPSSAPAAAATR